MKNRCYKIVLLLLLAAPSLAQAQDIYSNLNLPTDSIFLSDRQYITDLLRKERYLHALATNIELMVNEAKRFPFQYKFTPQEERDILAAIDKKLKQTANIDSLEKAYAKQISRLDSSRKAYDQLVQSAPRKSKEELDRDPVARANEERIRLAKEEVETAEELAAETKKRLEKLRAKSERTREAMERFALEGKKRLVLLLRDYARLNIQDFGYQGNAKSFYNFADKYEYERFVQYARFYAIRNEYREMRKAMLNIFDDEFKLRLYRIELASAVNIYNRGDYGTALLYFDDLQEAYKNEYGEVEDLIYYRAEANFGLGYYAEARKLYEQLVAKYAAPEYAEMNAFERTESEIKKLESDLNAQKDSMLVVKRQYQALLAAAKAKENAEQAGYIARLIDRQTQIIDEEIAEIDKSLSRIRRKYADVVADKAKNPKAAELKVAKVAPYRLRAMHRILFMSYAYNDAKQFQADLERFKPHLKKDNLYSDKIRVLAATVEYRNKQYEAAIEWARQVSDDSPMRNEADYVRAMAHIEMQNFDQAADALGRIVSRGRGLFEGQSYIQNAAYLQLGNIAYTKANRIMREARKILNSEGEARKIADSTLQAQFNRYVRSKQANIYDRQLAKILERIVAQDTVIERISNQLGSELLDLAISERDFQRLAYELQNRGAEMDKAEKELRRIQSEIDLIQKEGRVASERLQRMRESLARLQNQANQARFDLYKKFAMLEYAKAEEMFEKVDRGYVGKDIASVGALWAKFRQNRQKETEADIERYARNFRLSDNLYEAMFLSGYMKHIKDPTDADMIMKEYDFVYNGMMAFDFADKFLEQRSVLRQQKTLTDAVVSTSNNPVEVQLGAKLSVAQESVLNLLKLDRAVIAKAQKSLLPEERKALMKNRLEEIKAIRAAIPATFKNLASAAEKTQASVEKLLKMSVQTLSDEQHLFAKHAPILVAGEKADYQRDIDFYKKVAREEFVRSERLANAMQTGVAENDPRKKLLNAYYADNANLQKNQSNAVETILAQREFFGTRVIERAGTSAQYALTSLMYNEIQKSRAQIANYERVVGTFRNAIKRKIGQLEFYLSQLDLEATGEKVAPITRADMLQKEFDENFRDFRKAFFIGTDYLKFSMEQKNVQVP
ncbi:MAG: hypothetical protein NZM06_10525 [Chloroherpetonaceae bacterium]|nr:hypothetical protein [Chloroherpetonaceae bacterium]MDW8437093.1 hypothetical protein [Chloroherpetonaceae bacterium]